MLFRQRHKKKFWHRVKHNISPPQGLRRSVFYHAYRLGRLRGGPYNIAAGVACGAAISFTPFLGFHLLGGWLLCLLTRGNALAMLVGSVIGNPWTFPVIWLFIYYLGTAILGHEPNAPTIALTMENLRNAPEHIFWPMTVGGCLSAVVVWFLSFFPVYRLVRIYQDNRKKKIADGRKRFHLRLKQKRDKDE